MKNLGKLFRMVNLLIINCLLKELKLYKKLWEFIHKFQKLKILIMFKSSLS